jgi:hypothetical protein
MPARQPPRRTDAARARAKPAPPLPPDGAADVDVWQAASLLVGLYGTRALHVAAARVSELDEEAVRDRQVWNRIIIKIAELLCAGPAGERN